MTKLPNLHEDFPALFTALKDNVPAQRDLELLVDHVASQTAKETRAAERRRMRPKLERALVRIDEAIRGVESEGKEADGG